MGDPIQPEDWNSHSHASIYSSAQAFDTGKPATLAGAYRDAGTAMHEEATVMGRKVQLAVTEHWRGQAAQGMQSAYGEFFKDVDGYVTKLFSMANALPPVGSAMDTSKASIQPPMPPQTTTMGRTMGLSDAQLKQKAAEDEKYARWQMSNLFSQPVVSAGSGADINDAPAGGTGGGAAGVTPGGGGASGGATGMSGEGGKLQSPSGADGLADRNTKPQLAGGDGQQAGAGQGQGGGSGSGGGAPGGGSPSGMGSGAGGLGSGSDRSGYGPGMVPGSTQAAYHQPPTSGVGGATSGPGSLRPGFGGVPGAAPGTSGGTNPAGIGASGVRGVGPMGMGAMRVGSAGAHSKGAKDDHDGEHAIPEMLKNLDNSEEFFGEQRKFIPGGVLGDFKAMEQADKQLKDAEKRRYRSLGWDVDFGEDN
ncbi:WXG100 family type VII secretion target [Mycobacteroides chelonae]|uniref:WXG100 family type VII secretion target n=1 Tax=Mycobacteroides chelonae TaxID=1774 RepID=UPI0009942DCD|nr:hypothetical protein [Mycobacteroides chelonae]